MEGKITTSKQLLGSIGEKLALNWYLDKGYEFVASNVIVAHIGEIDLIVKNKSRSGYVQFVFAEVKTRSSAKYGYGYESVNNAKLLRMRRCASAWVRSNRPNTSSKVRWRIDVVSVDKNNFGFEINVFQDL